MTSGEPTAVGELSHTLTHSHIISTSSQINRFLSVRHQFGGSIPIVANGQTLDQSRGHVKLNGRKGHVRIRLPPSFFDGITSGVEGQALGVMVLDKLQNSTDKVGEGIGNGSPPGSAPGGSRSLEVKSDKGVRDNKSRDLVGEEPIDTEQRYAEVGFVIEFLLEVDAPTLRPSISYVPSTYPTKDSLSATVTPSSSQKVSSFISTRCCLHFSFFSYGRAYPNDPYQQRLVSTAFNKSSRTS